jgi:very-short-patch-repair endonuclease
MAALREQSIGKRLWALVRRQHGVVTHEQLLGLGYTGSAIRHRLTSGRLHSVYLGVYAVGRPILTRKGQWMAAVLACGPCAVISHSSAAALLRIRADHSGPIHVTAPVQRRRPGIVVHRRATFRSGTCDDIPVTCPAQTLVDLAADLPTDPLEAAINQADKLDLIDPERLRSELERFAGVPGVAKLRTTLDRRTFTTSDSELERRFRPIARRAGLPAPLTQQMVSGFRVDFYWPDLGLVVETDGLRYHRTPQQQARDRVRDQAHTAAGLTPLRFTRAQIRFGSADVERTLRAVAKVLRPAR